MLFPSSCGIALTAGIGTLPVSKQYVLCCSAGGLPGFIGPFPSTSLDESNLTHSVVYVYK